MIRQFNPERLFGRYFRERQPSAAEQRREWVSVILCVCATIILCIVKSRWVALAAACALPTAFMWALYPEVLDEKAPGIRRTRICIGILHVAGLLAIVFAFANIPIEKKGPLLLVAIACMIGEPILASVLLWLAHYAIRERS